MLRAPLFHRLRPPVTVVQEKYTFSLNPTSFLLFFFFIFVFRDRHYPYDWSSANGSLLSTFTCCIHRLFKTASTMIPDFACVPRISFVEIRSKSFSPGQTLPVFIYLFRSPPRMASPISSRKKGEKKKKKKKKSRVILLTSNTHNIKQCGQSVKGSIERFVF